MRKLPLLLIPLSISLGGLALWAADFWASKPYTEWTEKDLQKVMTDSPWSKKVSVAMEMGPGAFGGGGGAARGGGGPDPNFGTADSGGGGGRGGRGGGGRGGGGGGGDAAGGGGDAGGGGTPEVQLTVRWQTAPTIMEAVVKSRFGAEAGKSEDSKKLLEPDSMYYVLWVAGLPSTQVPRDEEAKKELLAHTTLAAKDKDAIVATAVVFPEAAGGQGGLRPTDAHFLFPRKIAFTPEDKEVEFSTKFGKSKIQAKFVLKSMEINGKLGL